MLESIRNKYLYTKTQIIEFDKNGVIINSDNSIFKTKKINTIFEFHPFFETLSYLLTIDNEELTFYCVHLTIKKKSKTVDILFNSGNENSNPFVILFDFTNHYTNFQNIAQEKNETVLNFHLEELKTRQLISEKEFKNKFLANVGHDLKTPINATNWFIGMLQKTKLDATQTDIVALLNESNQTIKGLIDDILDLSKIELGKIEIKPKKLEFAKMLHRIREIYLVKAASKNLDFVLIQDKDLPEIIVADAIRLEQILINLLDNAIKFTKKGNVVFTVKVLEKSAKTILLSFIIEDTGIGFSPKFDDEVYQSFKKLHKTQIEGSGLGLSIVSNLVALMNGSITYETEVNKGTIFNVTIPFGLK